MLLFLVAIACIVSGLVVFWLLSYWRLRKKHPKPVAAATTRTLVLTAGVIVVIGVAYWLTPSNPTKINPSGSLYD